MKTNDSAINGGTVCGVPGASCKSGDWRQAYANYLVQYAKDYAAAGVPLSYVGPENEGNLSVPQDSMIMSPAQTANLMQVLGATLARSGLSTRAECCATESWDYAQKYAAAIETDKAANTATALFTSHGYFVAPDSPLRGWSKPVWETEWAPFDTGPFDAAWDDGSQLSGFTWAQNIYTGLTAANLGAFLYLWGANTSTTTITGPNTGLVEVNGSTVATSGRLWAFASYSRFIRPGAVRIGTTTSDCGPRGERVSQQRRVDRGDRSEQRPQPPGRDLLAARARRSARHALPDRHIPPALRADPDHGQEQRLHRDPAAAVARHLRHPIVSIARRL